MSASKSSPQPVPARVAKARHDLRNPLGEIIGYAEILSEETVELGLPQLRPELADLLTGANALLQQLNQTLELDQLRERPASVADLCASVNAHAARCDATIRSLSTQCRALATRPFLDDLERIAAANQHMAERAPLLLGDLYEGEHDDLSRHSRGRADDAFASGISGDTIFFRRPDAASESEGEAANPTDTIFLTRPTTAQVEGASILVVDDNPASRALLTRRLARSGHRVAHAEDGEHALSMVRQHPFDLMLLDVLMPRVTGYDVLSAMKADPALRHLPVIMITGLDDLDSLVRCIEGGAEDYLTKPFDPVLLKARIGACLEKKRLRDKEQLLLAEIRKAKEQSEALLLNILPRSIADRLKAGESTIVDTLPEVTVLFADLANFTELSAHISGVEMVGLLNELFTTFDLLAQEQGLEKIKTIGDAYMVVGGLPTPRPDHAQAIAELALNMMQAVAEQFAQRQVPVRLRIGINSGPVVAGVIGRHKFSYDLWGDTVNTASRMESHGQVGAIQVSEATRQLLERAYTFTRRDLTQVKGKGDLTAWLLTGRLAPA